MTEIIARLSAAAILPVITVNDLPETIQLVGGLAAQGVAAIEIVLRSEPALDAIEECRRRYPQLLVGAGTVMNAASLAQAVDRGAQFAISPGATPCLLSVAAASPIPFIPGAVTSSEVMLAIDAGLRALKFYPANAFNAGQVLEDYARIFPAVKFIPTGKIGFDDIETYASLPNVIAIGGSWMLGDATTGAGKIVARSLSRFRAARRATPRN